MSDHYIVTLDHEHLRIYAEYLAPGQVTPRLKQVEAKDFPAERSDMFSRDGNGARQAVEGNHRTDHPRGTGSAEVQGRTFDERFPVRGEERLRQAKQIAHELEAFFQEHSDASWDYEAGPELNGTVFEMVSPSLRKRLRRSVAQYLADRRVDEMRAHFAGA